MFEAFVQLLSDLIAIQTSEAATTTSLDLHEIVRSSMICGYAAIKLT